MTREEYIKDLESDYGTQYNYKEAVEECKSMHGRLVSRQVFALIRVFSDRIKELNDRVFKLEYPE